MTIHEAIKWIREADFLELCSGNTIDRQAIDVAIRSLEAWGDIQNEIHEIIRDNDIDPLFGLAYGATLSTVHHHIEEIERGGSE